MTGTLPRILLLATGGTIASETDAGNKKSYDGPAAGLDALMRAARFDGAHLTGEQIASIGSQDMDFAVWRRLLRRIRGVAEHDEADAVVITHGTDTLEETAFFLDLVAPRERPIVITGAMWAANALGADGPRNLLSALRVAIDPAARGRGVLSVMDDEIRSARTLSKARTTGVNAFRSALQDRVGVAKPSTVQFYHPPRARRRPKPYALADVEALPRVIVIYCYADMDKEAVEAQLLTAPAGIVVAGLGDGNIPNYLIDLFSEAARRLVVVRSTRVSEGEVPRNGEVDDDRLGFIAARDLNPCKSRILLQILLANGVRDLDAIQSAFDAD
jgi:L-asparaginase